MKILVLVEGHTEESFFRHTCSNARPLRVLPQGKDVEVSQVIRAAIEQLEFWGPEYTIVVIWWDRENRTTDSDAIAAQIATGVASEVTGRKIIVGVPDREIENWILADEALMRQTLKDDGYSYEHEGEHGKGVLTAKMGKPLGPTDKALLLKKSDCHAASKTSPSLHNFVKRTAEIEWHWTKRST